MLEPDQRGERPARATNRPLPLASDLRQLARARRLSAAQPDGRGVVTHGLVLDLVVNGLGMGAMVQVYIVAAQNAVAPPRSAITTAALQFFRTIGGASR